MLKSGLQLGGSSVSICRISSPPASVARLQLDEWVFPARRQVGGGRDETTADGVLEGMSESDVKQRVDEVVGREVDCLHHVSQFDHKLQYVVVQLFSPADNRTQILL